MSKPIIFIGPSIPLDEARAILDADFRPPIARGDLDAMEARDTRVIGIIDGKFDQARSISPRELMMAASRGYRILGSSSMGALRAAEVPTAVLGIGRVYQMYATGTISDDDEVAVVFDPDSGRALSEPMVNIRFAIESLRKREYLTAELATELVTTAKSLPYAKRVYPIILREAGIDGERLKLLNEMLRFHDLKRNDAVALLEFVASEDLEDVFRERPPPDESLLTGGVRQAIELNRSEEMLIWETGDTCRPEDLACWLAQTGCLWPLVQSLHLYSDIEVTADAIDQEALLNVVRGLWTTWGWGTAEETEVTLADILQDFDHLQEEIGTAEYVRAEVGRWLGEGDEELAKHIRSMLLRSGLDLKRELMRRGAFESLSAQYTADADSGDRALIEHRMLQRFNRCSWQGVRKEYQFSGLDGAQADEIRNRLASIRTGLRGEPASFNVDVLRELVEPDPKAPGSRTYGLPMSEALARCEELVKSKELGITRIGGVEGLVGRGHEPELFISQAYGSDFSWSTSLTSGKGTTKSGAYVGAVMEMFELTGYARVEPSDFNMQVRSYDEMVNSGESVLNPRRLPLPYDTRWKPGTPIDWIEVTNLLDGQGVWVPAAYFLRRYQFTNNPTYSQRVGCTHHATNGGASGFSRAGAMEHALGEYIERHNVHCWEALYTNPGLQGAVPIRFIDPSSLADDIAEVVERATRLGLDCLLVDMTVDIGVPTVGACIPSEVRLSKGFEGYGEGITPNWGYGTHPDYNVAVLRAVLEATQSLAMNAAGAREDADVAERSLGRHERPSTSPRSLSAALYNPRVERLPLRRLPHAGAELPDVRDDLEFTVQRLAEAGLPPLWLDLLPGKQLGGHLSRFVVPDLGSTLPVCTMPRIRRFFLSDFLGPDEYYNPALTAGLPPSRLPY